MIELTDSDMTVAVQNYVEKLLLSTKRAGITDVIDFLHNSGYYSACCHRHHHFEGGMSQHAVETYLHAKKKADADIPNDSLAIVCLLHDLCDIYGFHQYHRHGKRSVDLITKECHFELTDAEHRAILWHMHGTREIEKLGAAFEQTTREPLWQLLHKADHYSAGHPMSQHDFYAYALKSQERSGEKTIQ